MKLNPTKQTTLLAFIQYNDDWQTTIQNPPFNISLSFLGDYVLLRYNQFSSDMSYRLVQDCRGCIIKATDNGWRYVCRPFRKFFNYGEENAADVDWSTARTTEKVDGSLMKLWADEGVWHLSTMGTIDAFSAQVSDLGVTFGDIFVAAAGCSKDLSELTNNLNPEFTYLFEVTSPETKVVINYPKRVYYLTKIHTENGVENFDKEEFSEEINMFYPKVYDLHSLNAVLDATAALTKEQEGFVVNDLYGNRIKCKGAEYLTAAHLMNNHALSNRNLVDYIKNDQVDDFLAYCPEFTDRIDVVKRAIDEFCKKLDEDWEVFRHLSQISRADFAAKVAENPNKDYLFTKAFKDKSITSYQYLMNFPARKILKSIGLKQDN